MVDLISFEDKVDLTDYTLVIPSVSVGNVPQLTVDLAITSMSFRRIATIWHPAIVPAIGSDPYKENSPEICTACELYVNSRTKLALIQLRSAIEYKLALTFFQRLKDLIVELKFKDVVILTSSFDYELHIVSNHKFFYITNNEKLKDVMQRINVKPKEPEFDGKYVVHGSGFAVKLYEVLKEFIDCTILIKFTSEGDNRPDAISTMEILSKFVSGFQQFDLQHIQYPCSWRWVFGGPPPLGIY